MMELDAAQRGAWAAVQALNRAWTGAEADPERLAAVFHPAALALTPDGRRLESGAACVAGWLGFARGARIHAWRERDVLVRVHAGGRAAVVAYEYELDAEGPAVGGGRKVLRGRDLFFLVLEGQEWRVVADQFSPLPDVARSVAQE